MNVESAISAAAYIPADQIDYFFFLPDEMLGEINPSAVNVRMS